MAKRSKIDYKKLKKAYNRTKGKLEEMKSQYEQLVKIKKKQKEVRTNGKSEERDQTNNSSA